MANRQFIIYNSNPNHTIPPNISNIIMHLYFIVVYVFFSIKYCATFTCFLYIFL